MTDILKRFVLLLALFLACACNQGERDNRRKNVTSSLVGKEMQVKDLWGFRIVAAYKDYLFLQENRGTSQLNVYQISEDSLKLFKGLIDRGRGPREFYYANFSLSGDTLFVSNANPSGMQAIYGISLNDMSKIDDRNTWKEYTFPDPMLFTYDNYAPCGEGKFIVAGGEAMSDQIISLADCISGKLRPLYFWPKDDTEASLLSKQMVYMSCELVSRGDRICYAHSYARYMFIASVEGDSFEQKAMIYSNLPRYGVKPDGNISYGPDGERGIVLASTQKYIFAQVGRTRQEVKKSELYKGYPDWFYDEVEVYDWEGNFIANYQTDKPFSNFVVSSDNHYLYTITQDLETLERVVMRYELPL